MNKREVLNKVSKNGRIFGATFTKKDGSLRTMNCRLGVTKHLTGGKNTKEHLDNYVTGYSINDKGYRTLNLDTLRALSGFGQDYEF